MIRLQTNSIKKRLTWKSMLAGSSALLLACTGFVLYELLTFRISLVRALTTQAEIVGRNSVTELTFADSASAAKTLAALQAEPVIKFDH